MFRRQADRRVCAAVCASVELSGARVQATDRRVWRVVLSGEPRRRIDGPIGVCERRGVDPGCGRSGRVRVGGRQPAEVARVDGCVRARVPVTSLRVCVSVTMDERPLRTVLGSIFHTRVVHGHSQVPVRVTRAVSLTYIVPMGTLQVVRYSQESGGIGATHPRL